MRWQSFLLYLVLFAILFHESIPNDFGEQEVNIQL